MNLVTNLFMTITDTLLERGEDPEAVARDCAKALEAQIRCGSDLITTDEVVIEFRRLIADNFVLGERE